MIRLAVTCAVYIFSASALAQTVGVTASVETDPVPGSGDAADDSAVWIHPTDPGLSIVIGTDKTGGLAVYDMSGSQIQFLADGKMNNVDVRYNFPLGTGLVDLVATGNRSDDSIAVYKVNPSTRLLEDIAASDMGVGITVYGSCMYRSPTSGFVYFIVNAKSGDVEQWRLFDNGNGKVSAAMERTFDVGSQTEGCVADDELAFLYIGEERTGIWKYGAEPSSDESRVQVDQVGSNGNLTGEVEGLTLYYRQDGKGYLIASSQGSDEYVIYERENNNAYIGTFEISGSGSIDGVSDTDGIDVVNAPLGPLFPNGVFVAQDGSNSGGNQNFKLVPWQNIANAFAQDVVIDLNWNPRSLPSTPTDPVPRPPTELAVE